jgi:hypothetical protein
MEKSGIAVRFANQAFVWLERVSRRKILICLLAMVMTMAVRIVLLPRIPIPKPFVSDEFSYLLGAETFASGRITNQAHPMWVHFETLQELMQPTYMSKYPPGQAIFLALGWKLVGHPWFGVWASFGLFAASLCWMLQNWVPPVYALLGTLFTLARISVLGYWMNSYWGGAVAAIGGCLLLGALPRLARRQVKSKDVALAGIGLVLLANSRPYEGLVMSAAVVVALLWWRRLRQRKLSDLIALRCVIPLLLVCGTGAVLDGYYNFRVTGNPSLLPYKEYFQQYQIHPPWIIFSGNKAPIYRHTYIENTWREQEEEYRANRTSPLHNFRDAYAVFAFFCPALYFFPLAVGILLSGSYRFWAALGIYCFTWAGLFIESNKAPHYIAVCAALLPLLVLYGLRLLRIIGGRYGPLLVLTLAMLFCLQGRASEQGRSYETRGRKVVSTRMMALEMATKVSGSHLILVRYSPDHVDKSDGCVYNAANIDAARVVWAMDMGTEKNRELIDYYQGTRKIWLYQPDVDPNKLIPYQSEN